MTAPGDSNSLMVQNLRPGTRYKFRVAAENRHGISPESQAVTTRMLDEGIPKQPLWKNTVFILHFQLQPPLLGMCNWRLKVQRS